MRNRIWLGATMVVALFLAAAGARGQEAMIALAKVPKPVLSAVKTRFPAAALTGASQETEGGKLIYEVTIQDKGQHIDVTLTPAGEIIMIEKEIAAKVLPAAVARVLERKYPKAAYKIVEEIIAVENKNVENKQEKLAYYELLLIKADKKWIEVQITAEGKIVNEEAKKPGEENRTESETHPGRTL